MRNDGALAQVNRLLTGSRKFKVRKGRGATYTEQDKAMLMRIWREVGCPCTTYFQANIGEWLRDLCEDYSNYRNFCVPCKMLVPKVKRKEGKGFTCEYYKPQTPYARVLADNAVSQDVKDALMRLKAKINGIELYHRILKRLRRIRRMQEASMNSSPDPVSPALAPCGASPSGSAFGFRGRGFTAP